VSQVLIRRMGSLIELSPDGVRPLDPVIANMLTPKLTYQHKTLLRGHERYSVDGHVRTMDIETRNMYSMEAGRLITGFGFLTTIVEILQRHGVMPSYVDLSPAKPAHIYQPDWENVRRHVQFRARQEECLQVIANNPCGLINAAMGFGKSFSFEALAHLYPRARFAIVVRSVDIAKGIVRKLVRTIPNVGLIGGGSKVYGNRVTVYTAGSVHYAIGDEDFLLCDEVHQLMTDATATALATYFRYTRNFGFSATLNCRMDGADAQLEQFFGRQIFKLTYQEAVDLGLVVPIHVRWLPIRLATNPAANKKDTAKDRWGIWRNEERNRIIANDIRERYPDPDTQILVLTDKVEHAIMLWQNLKDFELCFGQSISDDDIDRYKTNGFLPPGFVPMTSERRDELRQGFSEGKVKRVIATDIWSTGVDFSQLQVLYRADARSSKIMDAQAPGRVSRIDPASGKQNGEVVDCCDFFDSGFRAKSEQRRRNYAALGWSQDWPKGQF